MKLGLICWAAGMAFRWAGYLLEGWVSVFRLGNADMLGFGFMLGFQYQGMTIQVTNKYGKDAREEFGAAPQGGLLSLDEEMVGDSPVGSLTSGQ